MAGQLAAAARLSLALAAVSVLTWIGFSLLHLNSATAAFTYLLLILSLATSIGRTESVAASVASMIAYDFYFLRPAGASTIGDPQNWVTMLAFFVTAVLTSQLSSTIRNQANEAAAGHKQVQRMYDFSRGLMLTEETGNVAARAAHQLIVAFGAKGASVLSLPQNALGCEGECALFYEQRMREVSDTGEPWFGETESAAIVPIRFGGHPLGSMGVAGAAGMSEVGLYALTQLVAAEMERAIAQEEAARMLATREGEHLKSVLLDALAHELKTPLTSIKAAASTILSAGMLEPEAAKDMAAVINEEADRLTSLVSDAIELARLGSGMVELKRTTWPVEEVLESAAAAFSNRLEDRALRVHKEPDLPPVLADRKLADIALRQLVANALLYSPPGTPVDVSAVQRDGMVALGVANEGPPVPPAEQQLLFEKFYRGQSVRGRVAGSGMGLSIARDIAMAHGGRIWLENDSGRGVRFWFTLPVVAADKPLKAS